MPGNAAGTQGGADATKRALQILEFLILPQARDVAAPDFGAIEAELRADTSPDAVGVLSMLYLFGVPNEAGSCALPHGFPRNATLALAEISRGLEHGCGLCHTLLGLLLALGHPMAVNRSRVWLQDAPLQAAFRVRAVQQVGKHEDIRESGVDAVPLAYLVGAQLGDDVGSMAYAFSEAYNLRTPSWRGVRRAYFSTLSRVPKPPQEAPDARCLDAVMHARRPALAAARHAEADPHRDWAQLPLAIPEPFQRSRAYGDWLTARMESESEAKHAYGRAIFDGVGGHGRNITAAGDVWQEAVRSGRSHRSHWNLLMLQMRGDYPAADPQYLEAVLQGPSFEHWQKAMALHYAHRMGIGGRQLDPEQAGIWLLRAAELGDSNAQVLAGKALRGEHDSLLDGVNVSANETLGILFLRTAALGGRASAAFMVADHDRKSGNCPDAYEAFANLAILRHPATFTLYAHARRAYQLGDSEGAALRLLLLAEAGSWTAMREAAELLGTRAHMAESWPCGGGWRRCSLALRLRLGRGQGDMEQLAAAAAALRLDARHDSERARAGDLARIAADAGNLRGVWEAARWESCEPSGDIDRARGHASRLWEAATSGEVAPSQGSGRTAPLAAATAAVVLAHAPDLFRGGLCSLTEYEPDGAKRLGWPALFTAVVPVGIAGAMCLWRRLGMHILN